MNKFFLNIYDRLSRNKSLSIFLMAFVLGLCVLSALRLDYKENIADFLPTDPEKEKYTSVYDDLSNQGQITVIFAADTTKLISDEALDAVMDAMDAFDAIERSMDETVFEYVKRYLTENIIYNHYSESMRKYSQNGIPTQKITIENGFVRGIATYSATHSSPRIDTLRNYATDLGLIAGYRITPKGLQLLNTLKDD